MSKKLSSIVILTYNQLEYIKLCIESIRKYTAVPYEIIIVDNASNDGTVEYLGDTG
jgi:glycosyltransferase involved in cell wall biosynthesis